MQYTKLSSNKTIIKNIVKLSDNKQYHFLKRY